MATLTLSIAKQIAVGATNSRVARSNCVLNAKLATWRILYLITAVKLPLIGLGAVFLKARVVLHARVVPVGIRMDTLYVACLEPTKFKVLLVVYGRKLILDGCVITCTGSFVRGVMEHISS